MAYSKLKQSSANFSEMINAFGVVTVMDAKIYAIDSDYDFKSHTATQIRDHYLNEPVLATINSLKIANVTVEGPNKTVTGGQYSNPLIKFGKSARLEMQDALGRADAIEAFGGSVNEYVSKWSTVQAMHITEDFAPTRLIIGESFFISQSTGEQVKVDVVFYQVLPDSIFNLSQDAEGDATVFDMNADLLTTSIKIPDDTDDYVVHGVFYSILPTSTAEFDVYVIDAKTLALTKNGTAVATTDGTVQYSTDGGATWVTGTNKPTVEAGNTYGVALVNKGVRVFEGFVVGESAS